MTNVSPHEALIHIMISTSAADRKMTDNELATIGTITKSLPMFEDFDTNRLVEVAQECSKIHQAPDGLEQVIANAMNVFPDTMYETIYALAVEVAAADLNLKQEELHILAVLRNRLGLDRLVCAAIERGATARHQRI